MTAPSDTARTACTDRHERWRGHVDAQARGTLSQRAYCEANSIAYSSFTYWRRRLADLRQADARGEATRVAAHARAPAFVPVRVASATMAAGAAAGTALAVVLPSGVRIEGIAAANLRLVTALAAAL